jgi:hypothetical protein
MIRKEMPARTAGTSPREGPGFQLDLPTQVLGHDASGREFEETTVLETMSPAAAVFDLKSPVARGTDLKLIVCLPPRLSEGENLSLVIRGRVAVLGPPGRNGSGARISLKLESHYVIGPRAGRGAA